MRICLCVGSSEKKATDYKSQKALGQKQLRPHTMEKHTKGETFFSKFLSIYVMLNNRRMSRQLNHYLLPSAQIKEWVTVETVTSNGFLDENLH